MGTKTLTRPQGRAWYRIEARGESAQVDLFDEIGQWGIGAGDFVKELREVTASMIDLHLSSPGGEVFDGLAIYAALRRHPAKVTVHIDGLAASIASVIAMAGDVVKIDRYAQMMIHEAHAVAVGATKDMAAMASLLDQYSDNIAEIYTERAGGTATAWRERMRAETWYTADEAVKAGLADEVTGTPRRNLPTATWDLSIFNFAGRGAAPDPFLDLVDIPATETPEPPEPTVEPTPEPAEPVEDARVTLDPDAFNPEVFRAAMIRSAELDYDPRSFTEVMASVAASAPAPPVSEPQPVDLGPLPSAPIPEPEPPPNPFEVIRAAMTLAANDAPAPPQPHKPEDPATEPGFLLDASAFRAALRRATSE